jgi:hypothetical protein
MEKETINKRVVFIKENYKKVKIAAEVLEIDKKENEAVNEVVNKAIEFYFKEKIVPSLVNG